MAEVLFPVKLTPDERNAGAFCWLRYMAEMFFPVKLTPDERNAGAF